jgi:drug/metabolite transporter (DMT)-like permease
MWWATIFGTLGYGAWLATGPGFFLSPGSWLPFLISAICETGYFITLVRGYAQGDLSLVYPISRGSAPIFTAIWSAIVLAESLPRLGYAGIGLMVAGLYIASLPVEGSLLKLDSFMVFRNSSVGWALASAIFISIYSVSDKVAVAATNPLVYNWWVFAGNSIFWAPIAWQRFRFKANFDELRNNWWIVIVTGVLMIGAYAFALWALSLTSASYVTAGRGFSVIIGAGFGSLLLKERFGKVRILGATLMVAGLALMAFS